ncbi:fungal specific transcription [Diplodia corticola]|uniref:Fungal specific transcription n=1 Tax=Diplodia corticola TaxID=236234 RepID=A0A1J9QJR2_9PEZI|nr:fungal specific transcription [Diplodia corticola]OJD29110.1 fungal specific transcription [Diplodia corticola]
MKRSFTQMTDLPAGSSPHPQERPHAPHPPQSQPLSASTPDHTPKISRKIRACKECQSRKVKCDIAEGSNGGSNPCARCRRLGLKCVINKSLQTLLDDENEWKRSMEIKYEQLQHAVSDLLHRNNLPSLESLSSSQSRNDSASPALAKVTPQTNAANSQPSSGPTPPHSEYQSPRTRSVPGMAMTRDNSPEPPGKEEPDEGAMTSGPMASLFEVTKLKNLRSSNSERLDGSRRNHTATDIIAQGKISEAQAEEFFARFNASLNQYIWGGVAMVHDNLQSVRESSPLLLTAILSVTALHVPDADQILDVCYNEFLALVSESMFERHHSLDDVRALCIGAFYLSEVSWKLSGHAVRMATEMHLHTAYSKAIMGSMDAIERARLWYLLYVCDHHFSLAYNRPPVIHEDESVSDHERFLSLPTVTNADLRLQSQVGVFKILSRVFNKFGHDSDRPITMDDLPAIRSFNASLDEWKNTWESRLAPNPYIDTYPAKGCTLHLSFAKLQLNAICLRGVSTLSLTDPRREFINMAVENATTCLSFVLDEPDIRKAIVGVPLYLSTTITFSTVFLMKVHSNWRSAQLNTNFGLIVDLVQRVIKLLSDAKAGDRHVSTHTARGLAHMLKKFRDREARVMHAHAKRNPSINTTISNGSINTPQAMSPVDATMVWPPPSSHPSEIPMSWAGSSLDWFGPDEQYLPAGVFDAVASSLPVVGWPLNSPPSSESFNSTPRMPPVSNPATSWPMSSSNATYLAGIPSWTTDDGSVRSAVATPVQQARCAASVTSAVSATGTPVSSWLADNPNQPAWVED